MNDGATGRATSVVATHATAARTPGEIEIVVDGVWKTYDTPAHGDGSFLRRLLSPRRLPGARVNALQGVSLTVRANEFLSIVGPSGCGKTTLLRIVHGLVTPDRGEVRINGRQVLGPAAECGFVFQDFGLFPWRTVLDNAAFGLELRGVGRAERLQRARHYVELVGLSGFEGSFPHQLSGGMQQRVGLARTLAVEPEVLLMDEPFGALDAQTKRVMQLELLQILQRRAVTVVFVTHDLEEALFLSSRVVVMTRRPGRIKEVVEVPIPYPRDEEVFDSPVFIDLRRHLWGLLRAEQAT